MTLIKKFAVAFVISAIVITTALVLGISFVLGLIWVLKVFGDIAALFYLAGTGAAFIALLWVTVEMLY